MCVCLSFHLFVFLTSLQIYRETTWESFFSTAAAYNNYFFLWKVWKAFFRQTWFSLSYTLSTKCIKRIIERAALCLLWCGVCVSKGVSFCLRRLRFKKEVSAKKNDVTNSAEKKSVLFIHILFPYSTMRKLVLKCL